MFIRENYAVVKYNNFATRDRSWCDKAMKLPNQKLNYDSSTAPPFQLQKNTQYILLLQPLNCTNG